MKSCNVRRLRRVVKLKHLLRASAPSSTYRKPYTSSPAGCPKRFGSKLPMSKTIDGLGSPVSPLISATTLPRTTMPEKVIRIRTAHLAHLYNLEKLTILRITSQMARWGRPERPGSHTIDMKDVSKAEVMATFPGKRSEVLKLSGNLRASDDE